MKEKIDKQQNLEVKKKKKKEKEMILCGLPAMGFSFVGV